MTVVPLNNQSYLDLAIQVYGTIEAVFDLLVPNNFTVTDIPVVGSDVTYESSLLADKPIQNYYLKHDIRPATLNPEIEGQAEQAKGIGVMVVGSTLIPQKNE